MDNALKNPSSPEIDPASFRDASGFVFKHNDEIYRAVAPSYFENYSHFIDSGLYSSLAAQHSVIHHTELENFLSGAYNSYKIIKPARVPFISYPYEWCFSQLQAAALLTLKIQMQALKSEMVLKDASAFNVQFIGHRPVFIDSLSFEKYTEGQPWVAYQQFCRHFLAPLALMSYKSAALSQLLTHFIDGIPLKIASALLPRKSFFNSVISTHVLLHSKFQESGLVKKQRNNSMFLSKKKLLALTEHLHEGINSMRCKDEKETWLNYSNTHGYSSTDRSTKESVIVQWITRMNPASISDVGCNTGEYPIIAARHVKHVVAIDKDHSCIEALFKELSQKNINNILPLVVNIANPTPAIGWANTERMAIQQRAKTDMLCALALLHHLRIGNNIPFSLIARFFAELSRNLIIEFVPKNDPRVQQMTEGREKEFDDYTIENFTASFEKYFSIIDQHPLPDSGRILFLLTKK